VAPPAQGDYSPTPQVNIDLLRHSIQQSEARKAQEGLDKMIREAVEMQTEALQKENQALQQKLNTMYMEVQASESQAGCVIGEANDLRAERDRLAITLADTRRDMQAVIDMYEQQLAALHDDTNTPEWYSRQSEAWAAEKGVLSEALTAKTKEAEAMSFQVEALTKQVQESSSVIAQLNEQVQRGVEMQLSERGADEMIAKLRAEASEAKMAETQLRNELREAKSELARATSGGPDYAYPIVDVPLLPDDAVYTASALAPQTILCLGAKHGVGASTVAMNLAAAIAGKGYKTLLVEVNASFPLANHFFEFTHVPFGIDEAIEAIAAGDMASTDRAIIRPHGLRPAHSGLAKVYRKLPPGLHFMLFSNASLDSHAYERNHQVNEASLYTLLSYLTKRQQYSHIILDVQAHDHRLLDALLNSGYPIDKLCMVLSQDPHAVVSAGTMISRFSQARAASLVAGGEFIINRFNPSAPLPPAKIEKALRVSPSQVTKLNEDSSGYLTAAKEGLPYLLNKGRFWMEFDALREKILD
jgi:predicted  nucleic acid-binding Zn-ribbon protein